MEVNIWQLKEAVAKETGIQFYSYKSALEMLKKQGLPEKLEKNFYKKIYSGPVPANTLEFFISDKGRMPESFGGNSLRVSDVVEVVSGGYMQPGFYYVDSYGFTKIEF